MQRLGSTRECGVEERHGRPAVVLRFSVVSALSRAAQPSRQLAWASTLDAATLGAQSSQRRRARCTKAWKRAVTASEFSRLSTRRLKRKRYRLGPRLRRALQTVTIRIVFSDTTRK